MRNEMVSDCLLLGRDLKPLGNVGCEVILYGDGFAEDGGEKRQVWLDAFLHFIINLFSENKFQ